MTEKFPKHDEWMALALNVATQALPEDVPVGAVIVYEGQLIASACNRRERELNPVGHAEMLAIQEAATKLGRWRLSGALLYVTLEPCPMCASAIQQARVGQVIFGAYDPVMGACGSRHGLLMDSPDLPVLGGIQEGPCSSMLTEFFRARR